MTEQERDSAQQQGEVIEQAEGAAQPPTRRPAEQADAPAPPTSPAQTTPAEVEGATAYPYVYAIGTVEPRFPA